MLNKKTIFNIIYAVAFFGTVTSCISLLAELLNVIQLKDVYINNMATVTKGIFSKPFTFYLIAFLISAAAVVCLVLRWVGILRITNKIFNSILLFACVALLVMSLGLKGSLQSTVSGRETLNSYFYMVYYTFRACVMSFIASMGTVLVCNLIDGRYRYLHGIKETEDEE